MKTDGLYLTPYLDHKEFPESKGWIYQFTNGTRKIEMNRQEIVLELLDKLIDYPRLLPIFNHNLILKLFPEMKTSLQDVTILPIVGAHQSFLCDIVCYEGEQYLLIDLLNVANYTGILSQTMYIMNNVIHLTLIRYLMNKKFAAPETYMEKLESIFFVEGFTQYLAWNEKCADYKFQSDEYLQRKKRSFLFLQDALQVEDPIKQEQILNKLANSELFDNFVLASGIFFLDDLYHKENEKGLCDYFARGPKDCFKLIF